MAVGVKVNVCPTAGLIVPENWQEAVFVPPAVVAAQFVVVERLLKSVLVKPRKPTCIVGVVAEFAVIVPP